MFNTEIIGKRIIELRKQANMTQVELADRMNVSYQAVSNWERGNSMPDISKLPELAEIFKCSIDDIINNQNKLITHIINNDVKESVINNDIRPADVIEIIPILKPTQLVEVVEEITENTSSCSLNDIAELIIHLDDDLLIPLIDKVAVNGDISDLGSIAVPASDELFSYVIDRLKNKRINMSDISPFVVHISEKNIDKLTGMLDPDTFQLKDIQSCVVHLSESNINNIITNINGENKINFDDISHMVVHLHTSNLINIINKVDVSTLTSETFGKVVVHLSEEIIDMIADITINNGKCSFDFYQRSIVHIPNSIKEKIVDYIIAVNGDVESCSSCIVHLPHDSRKKLAAELMNRGDFETLKKISVHV